MISDQIAPSKTDARIKLSSELRTRESRETLDWLALVAAPRVPDDMTVHIQHAGSPYRYRANPSYNIICSICWSEHGPDVGGSAVGIIEDVPGNPVETRNEEKVARVIRQAVRDAEKDHVERIAAKAVAQDDARSEAAAAR